MIQDELGTPPLAVPTAMSLSYHMPESVATVDPAVSTTLNSLSTENNMLSILAPPVSGTGPSTDADMANEGINE